MHTGFGRRLALTAVAMACLARLTACGSPTEVGISAVQITPDSADLIAGGEARLHATILNDHDEEVTDAIPEWSSDDPAVATVDGNGLVLGMSPGLATISATVAGASGSAKIRVLPPPSIALSDSAVAIAVGAGGPAPEPRTVAVGNGGAGSLGQLAAQVVHASGTSSWLSAELTGDGAPTTLTLTAATEGLAVGAHTATAEIASSEASVSPVQVTVTLTLTDIHVEETGGGTEMSEGGGTDQVLVALSTAPSESVVLDVSSDEAVVAVSPNRLTFTPESWDAPQAVTVTGVDDPAVDGEQLSALSITVDTLASDASFDGVAPRSLSVTTTDDDVAGLALSATGGSTRVDESGSTDQVRVVLMAQPLTDVEVLVQVDDPSEVTASPNRLTFTPATWSTYKTVTVRGVDDSLADGPRESAVTVRVDASASDDAFDDVEERTLGVRTDDDDAAGLVVVESGGSTYVDEAGATDQVGIRLTVQPLADVVLTVAIDDPLEATVAPATLTFTQDDWSTPQSVTVTGVDDAVMDGAQISTLTLSVDESASDPVFGSVPPETLDVVTADDEAVGVTAATPTGHPDVPADQLVASYDLTSLTAEGLLRDFSGRELHGDISGTTLIPAPRGGGRLFQVATDRIELPPRGDLDLDGPLSIVTRIRLDQQNRHQHIIACDDKFAFAIREADQVRLSNSRGDLAETLDPLSAGVWHSVIGVFRGTVGDVIDDSSIEIWIDGVRAPITFRNATGTPPIVWRDGVLHPTDACYIGFESHQGAPGHQNLAFHGAIDEMLVFGRALTHEEIQLLAVSP